MKVIPKKWLPTRWPIFQTLTSYLACDVWNAPTWVYILVTSFFILLWIAAVMRWASEEEIKTDKGDDIEQTKNKKGFSDRLKNALAEQAKHQNK